MPAMGVRWETMDLIEIKAVRFRTVQKSTMLHSASLQNPTEWHRNSPFFGSALHGPQVSLRCASPNSQVENIDILTIRPQPDWSWILGRFGFPKNPLGPPAPEESRGKIEQRGPQSEEWAPASQE